jgi:hypothetical protein
MTTDWGIVYVQERRRPGYVIENGKSVTKIHWGDSTCRKVTPPQREKRKAA